MDWVDTWRAAGKHVHDNIDEPLRPGALRAKRQAMRHSVPCVTSPRDVHVRPARAHGNRPDVEVCTRVSGAVLQP
jgi:hypothetical protein